MVAIARGSGAVVRAPQVVQLTSMDFNPKYVSQLSDEYYRPMVMAERRFWLGPLPIPKANLKRLWQNG